MIMALLVFVLMVACTAAVIACADNSALARGRLVDNLNDLLPQTQCGKCDYAGCRPYATAILECDADINQCPPGGQGTIKSLAKLTGRSEKTLDPYHGREEPPGVAVIDESLCIGCVKCIHACPVDAIVGAPKQMHTVIEQECTGCGLCIEPCPVDCISMAIFAGLEPDFPIKTTAAATGHSW